MQVATAASDRRRPRARTLRADFLEEAKAVKARAETVTWPSPRWKNDPVAFAHEVLGIKDLSPDQVALLESIRDNRNTTCRSGHKCGKSTALAIAALWFFATFDVARVVMTAVKAAQVEQVLWREVRLLWRQSQRGPHPLDGELFELARSGLRAEDGRQIFGMTARDGEGLAGISGANVLLLADEASGIKDSFFEVLGSSMAGSGGTVRKCYISNPTRTTGEFYRSHTVNADLFKCLHFSSENTPNARGDKPIPGLAGPEWIAEKKLEYGEDSYAYAVRVRGDFVHDKDGKILSLDLLALAQAAYDDAPDEGPLQLGIDPAGDGVIGDETAIAVRRGGKVITVPAWRSLTEDGIVENAVGLLRTYRRATDRTPRIAIDVEGGIGTRVLAKLRAHLEKSPHEFELLPVRAGQKLWGSPEFDTVRDGLWGSAQRWIKAGGALPEDVKLEQDLNAPSFTADKNQRYVATPKKELRKALGRSPDRGDAVCLAVWKFEEQVEDDVVAPAPAVAAPRAGRVVEDDFVPLDPYAGAAVWQGA